MEDSKYLLDKEIELTSENDLLGTKVYVDQLIEMINYSMKTNSIESIALYGGWGAGKSSVVKSLEKRLNSDDKTKNEYRFFTYNAWRYNNDSFRKNFIASIIDDDKEKKEYLNKVYTSETETVIKINDKLKKYWHVIVGIIILLMLVLAFANDYLAKDTFKVDTLEVITKTLMKITGLGICTYFADFIFKKIAVETQISKKKEYSPYDFANDFKDQVLKKQYYSIFLIDDIDRCSTTQVLEILETVKGILKNVDCYNYLFLIPLDKDRIISILKNDRNYSELDCQNYFSKIFDLSIDMKKIGNLNLFEMAKSNVKEINLQISNKSLSLLTDFIFLTPRDVKNTLNSLMTINKIVEKKHADNLITNEITDDLLEEFVVIYILEYKWKDFFNFLISDIRKSDIDLKIKFERYEETYHINKNDGEVLELSKFIGRLSNANLRYFETYNYLKNDNVSINRNLLDKMLNFNYKQLDLEDYKDDLFIFTLEYFYKTYLVERGMHFTYLPKFICMYFEFMQIRPSGCDDLKNSAIDLKIISNYLQDFSQTDMHSNKLILETFDIIINNRFSKLTENINYFYLEYMAVLIKSKCIDNKIAFAKMIIFDQIECKIETKENYINEIIKEDKNNTQLADIIKKFKNCSDSLDRFLVTSIENKRIDVISNIVEIDNRLLEKYEDDITEILTIKQSLNSLINLDGEKQRILENEIDIINLGLKQKSNKILSYVGSTNISSSSYCGSYLRDLLKINSQIAEKYIMLVDLYDKEKYGDFKLVSEIVKVLGGSDNNNLLLSTIELYEMEYSNELFILALSQQNNSIVKDYFELIRGNQNINLELWKALAKNKSNISYSFKMINHPSIVFNYEFFKNSIFVESIKQNANICITLMRNYSIGELFLIDGLKDYIKNLKKRDSRVIVLIDLLEDMNDYVECLNIVSKSSNKSRYHASFARILNDIKNVDKLMEIHDKYIVKDNVLDKVELNMIKDKVKTEFPQYIDEFDHILFNK